MFKKFLIWILCGCMLFCLITRGENNTVNAENSSGVGTSQTVAEIIASGRSFETGLTTVKNFGNKYVSYANYHVAQGMASDGEYLYFILKNSDSRAVIVKTTLAGAEVACSEILDLGHANDMTYDSVNKRLVVVHGSSSSNTANGNNNGRRLSFIDPNSLKVLHSEANIIPLGYAAGAIAYYDGKYYISQGGTTIRTATISANYDVKGISSVSRNQRTEGSTDYTAQGMGTDGQYLYFPMSGDDDNIVVVYTLDAKYVTTFHIPTTMESESLVFVDGSMYICFNHNGAVISKVTFSFDIDELDVSKYRSGTTYTAPTESGKVFAGWYKDAEFTTPLGKNVKTGKAYPKFVPANVLGVKAQISTETTKDSPSTDLRFLTSVNDLNYAKIGFKIHANGKTVVVGNNTVYKTLTVKLGEGVLYKKTPAQVFDTSSTYFKAYVLGNVPNSMFDTPIEVTPYWITLDGTTVYGKTEVKTVREGISIGLQDWGDGDDMGDYGQMFP